MFHRVKGSFDIIPQDEEGWKESFLWQHFEETAREISSYYGLKEIRTPVFEHTEVFTRTAGEESDIVSKEMYTFFDKADRSLSLRPELTAPIVRAFIENGMHHKHADRFYYIGPCFRYDRMQKGRYRQFHQYGVEYFAQKDPYIDAEAIQLLINLYKALGLKNYTLKINSIGDQEIRKEFARALKDYFTPYKNDLSEDSQRRLTLNPLRILDSKEISDQEIAKNAPKISEFLTPYRRTFFEDVKRALDSLQITYEEDTTLVRGLDYYSDTVFEIQTTHDTRAQNTLGGGGRYDGLMKAMGGEDLPGFGFGTGIERVLQSILQEETYTKKTSEVDFFIIPLSPVSKQYAFKLSNKLRSMKKSSLLFLKNFNLKKGLQKAIESKAKYAVIVGDEEIEKNTLKVKHLESREEKSSTEAEIFSLS
jgi:histidyl-tRNA synthetase